MRHFFLGILSLVIFNIVSAQTVKTDTLFSSILGRSVPVSIIEPRDFNPDKPHVVFYMLHYWDGDNTAYIDISLLSSIDDKPVIVIAPSLGNNWYINSALKGGERQRDFIEQELFSYVDMKYNTIKGKQAIGGSSMGGYGAMLIGLRNPERFGFIADLSGAVNAPFRSVASDKYLEPVMASVNAVFGDDPDNDVMKLISESCTDKMPYIFMAIGTHDEFVSFRKAHKELVRTLSDKKARFEFHEIYGGHFTGEVRWAVMPYIMNYLRDLILQPK